jgi:hypothetical protein
MSGDSDAMIRTPLIPLRVMLFFLIPFVLVLTQQPFHTDYGPLTFGLVNLHSIHFDSLALCDDRCANESAMDCVFITRWDRLCLHFDILFSDLTLIISIASVTSPPSAIPICGSSSSLFWHLRRNFVHFRTQE